MRRVLIVDDERLIREGLSESVNWPEWGFSVSGAAANGEEALASMRVQAADVVVTDVRMPVMDGIELCRILNRDYPATRTVILSGYSEFEFAQKAIEYNVYAYLLKPICEEKLSELFANLRREMDMQDKLKEAAASETPAAINREAVIEYLFLKLLSENIQETGSLYKELRTAGFDAEGKRFTVLAFEYGFQSEDRDNPAIPEALLRNAREYWGRLRFPVVYLSGILYVVVWTRGEPVRRDLRYYADEFIKYGCEKLDSLCGGPYRISAGIGGKCDRLERLWGCFQEARDALKRSFYLGEGQVIFHDEVQDCAEREVDEALLKNLTKEVTASLTGQTPGTLLKSVKKLFGYLESLRIADTNRLCVRFIRLYGEIVSEVKREYAFLSVPTEDEFYARIARCRTYRTMTHAFEQVFREVEGQIGGYAKNSGRHQFILRIKRYVQEHYNARLSLDQLAGEFFMNPSYLSRIFKEETGMNLSDHIQKVRISQAKKLLRDSNAKIQEIAASVGYEDYRHFCTVFKKATGLTPLQYRIR